MNKRFLLAIIFLLTGFITFAQYSVQSKYFVYLQTEPAQPFYIRINSQRIDANSSGYLILPQLKDGDYRLIVGFPDNKNPEMTYKFKVDSKDKGYLIKNFGADGWSLFDLQTMDVQKPLSADEAAALAKAEAPPKRPARRADPPKQVPATEQQPTQQPATAAIPPPATPTPAQQEPAPADNVSDFTKVLSKATNDKSILEQPKPEEKPTPAETTEPAVTNNTTPAANSNDGFVVEEKAPIPQGSGETPTSTEKAGKSTVVKVSQQDSGNGTVVVYEDRNTNGQTEQIEITIPASASDNEETGDAVAATEEKTPNTPVATQEPVTTASEQSGNDKFVVEEKPSIPQDTKETGSKRKKGKSAKENAPSVSNVNCRSVAGEDDFLKLRRDMAAKENDEKMIEEARRAFKNKCYSTAQVKYISSMFLSNAGKYNFFEAAKTHVSDPENFGALQSELNDQYYIDKFDALK